MSGNSHHTNSSITAHPSESGSALADGLETASHILIIVIPPPFVIIGLIGNLLSFTLMNQTKYQKSTSCYFMRCLALFDTLYIFGRMSLRYLLAVAPKVFLSESAKRPFCLFYFSVFECSKFIPPFILTAMTMDRFVAVTWPLKAAAVCTMGRARLSVVGISLVGAAVGLSQLLRKEQEEFKSWLCPYHFEVGIDVFTHAHAAISGYIPIACLVLFNAGISFSVLRSRQKSKRLFNSGRSNSSESSITKVSVSVTSFFILTSLPIRFMTIFVDNGLILRNGPGLSPIEMIQIKSFSNNLAITIENLNYCFNFYLYCLTSARFRKELLKIMACNPNKY
ncbi:somatostatin receptor type 4-like [Lineus longissimus]|uniref:somatostatin receptor type 4-like n=1 Tax=Lineus longissimus TaxID=88925 RepID=UPI00315D53F7